jgi:hypothetical protein
MGPNDGGEAQRPGAPARLTQGRSETGDVQKSNGGALLPRPSGWAIQVSSRSSLPELSELSVCLHRAKRQAERGASKHYPDGEEVQQKENDADAECEQRY